MFLANNLNKGGSLGGYQISRSLRFNSADSAYLDRTPASAGNRKTWTWSGWVKRSGLSAGNYLFFVPNGNSDATWSGLIFYSSDVLVLEAWTYNYFVSSGVYRDPSAWYHIVVSWDSTQATASERVKVYVNGQAAAGSYIYPAQNFDSPINAAVLHRIGVGNRYMTEINFIDGQALTPSSFGETNAQTGVWQPKAYSGSYGTNGFYLNFSDNSNTTAATLGKDYSGNGNNWTPNNFSVTAGAGNDSLVDSPTSYGTDTGVGGTVRGNYCTLNPLDKGTDITTVNGNLDVVASTAWRGVRATLGMSSGKWYCEYTPTAGTYHIVSISQPQAVMDGYIVNNSTAWGYGYDGNKYNGGSSGAYGSGWGVGDTIGIAFDADAGTLTFYKNGTSQGTAYSGLTSGPYLVGIGVYPSATGTFNFGQRPFAYTAPSGYKALCTQNLPTPTIGATTATQAGKYFNPVLYTGTGATRTVTGVNFAPDLVWIKSRSAAYNNRLYDKLRGVENVLQSNTTAAEGSDGGGLTVFGSDGFTLGSSVAQNENGSTFVSWNWKANGSGVTNTAGSITSTVSANTTSGFSVLTYTGTGAVATIGHGLGVAPSMIIVKSRSTPSSSYAARWSTYHASLGNTKVIRLESTEAAATASYWNNTSPTSTVFSVDGDIYGANVSGVTYVAYAFAEVAGYSKFGSYTGNGSSDGPFVYCGFRPAYVMYKKAGAGTSVGDWVVIDVQRDTYNVTGKYLAPNASQAESNDPPFIDILSNGFKIRRNSAGSNESGVQYIFAAFASSPFKYSLAR